MSRGDVHGVVTAEEWKQIGREDTARRTAVREGDLGGSLLTALAGMLALAMLATGPMWTVIHVWGGTQGHGPQFEQLWLVPFALTLAAGLPLAWALRRERSTGRFVLAGFLAVSLGIQLATCPWLH